MKKLSILAVLFLLACSSDVEKIQLEDIKTIEEGISELNELEGELDTIMNKSNDLELTHFKFLQDSLGEQYVFSSVLKPMKLDRYELVSNEKVQWSSNVAASSDGDHELYQASIHEYADSLKCKTALFNWLDCYGAQCTEIKVGKDTLLQKGTTAYVWVTENQILYLKSECGNDANLNRMKKLFSSRFNDNDLRYYFRVDCKGRLKWQIH